MQTRAWQRGFTLVEVLVALVVAMVVLLPLQSLFSLGLRAGALAENTSRALLLAESGLELYRARLHLVPGEDIEQIDSRYERRFKVQLWDFLPQPQDASLRPYLVTVSVLWSEGPRQRNITLSALMSGAAE
ncbi:prepilin-type N-terminal cleavage/methylation domain-containing protein [Indioceanicola profundi]|uniref:prepilin-type N-terminal cleavage/methylation domain-containing protein n=1 Tax=Indioceanicola profundi TaxID=2220096 RepID=UPI0013C477FA|nr:prepilin-type N-terminal cleavage/methylation domain-containing protein [Indioceanicola profundi]